jgi:acid phosphatase
LLAVNVGSDQPVNQAIAPAAVSIPRFDHVVITLFENKNCTSIKGSSSAPYFNSLASQGALSTNAFGITHPSQPNYIGLFSGSQQGVSNDDCPKSFSAGNLGKQLIDAGLSFKAYSEGLPSAGYTGCSSGNYRRKHAPWADFPTVSDSAHHVAFSQFPSDFTKLPTVSFVVPDMCNDMHDCSIGTGDMWLKNHLDAYAQWAKTHNSLLITTFDEDNFTSVNQIYTSFVGANVKVGFQSSNQINHYTVLRTVEDMYGLSALGNAANKQPITDIWSTGGGGGTEVWADGFETDRGWVRNAGSKDTATVGMLERGTPQQTTSTHSNQVKQLTAAAGSFAMATGAAAGASYGDNDLDGGSTSMTSPAITLPASGTLTLSFSWSVANGDNSGSDDYLKVQVLDGSTATTVFTQTGAAAEVPGQWRTATADLSVFAGKSVRLYLEAADAGTPSLFEAQVDAMSITQS